LIVCVRLPTCSSSEVYPGLPPSSVCCPSPARPCKSRVSISTSTRAPLSTEASCQSSRALDSAIPSYALLPGRAAGLLSNFSTSAAVNFLVLRAPWYLVARQIYKGQRHLLVHYFIDQSVYVDVMPTLFSQNKLSSFFISIQENCILHRAKRLLIWIYVHGHARRFSEPLILCSWSF
jgi:hypothetical protein